MPEVLIVSVLFFFNKLKLNNDIFSVDLFLKLFLFV